MPHLHIRTSGETNSEANDERTNHIFVSSFVASFALPFVALALEAVFREKTGAIYEKILGWKIEVENFKWKSG